MQTVTEQLKVAESLKGLWRSLLPDRPLPPSEQFTFWAGLAPENICCHAMNRGARKAYKELRAGTRMSDDTVVKYISGVMSCICSEQVKE
jgi:hypothetical protein